MFDKDRYLTIGVHNTIPFLLQIYLWEMINRLPVEKDRVQIFVLKQDGAAKQVITHIQERPEYEHTYTISLNNPVSSRVYVIDDGDYSTMLLADEY